jgi:hypothetical protein
MPRIATAVTANSVARIKGNPESPCCRREGPKKEHGNGDGCDVNPLEFHEAIVSFFTIALAFRLRARTYIRVENNYACAWLASGFGNSIR